MKAALKTLEYNQLHCGNYSGKETIKKPKNYRFENRTLFNNIFQIFWIKRTCRMQIHITFYVVQLKQHTIMTWPFVTFSCKRLSVNNLTCRIYWTTSFIRKEFEWSFLFSLTIPKCFLINQTKHNGLLCKHKSHFSWEHIYVKSRSKQIVHT